MGRFGDVRVRDAGVFLRADDLRAHVALDGNGTAKGEDV